MNKEKKYIYITDPFLQTVKDSQVLNWLHVLGNSNIKFDLIVITNLKYLINNNKLRKEKIQKARKTIPGIIRQIFIIRNNDTTKISQMIIFFNLLILLFRYKFIDRQNVIIQTRMSGIIGLLYLIKKIYGNIHIIYDFRGARAEEFLNGHGFNNIRKITNQKIKQKYLRKIEETKSILTRSDYVFCVSKNLKNYAINLTVNDRRFQKEKFVVIPGAADETQFLYNQMKRFQVRNELNFDNKIILTYTGKLRSHWHNKEEIFKLVQKLMMLNDKVFFLCITPEVELAKSLARALKINQSRLLIKYLPYEEIPKMLNASDFGIILRKDIATNHVASPTKIPEYLLCGLPVLISPNIGDYSAFIEENELGIIIKNIGEAERINHLIINYQFDRNRISHISKEFYSKQAVKNKAIKVYSNISKI